MLIRNQNDTELELVLFKDNYNNKELRKIYLDWLNDLSITRLSASSKLYTANKTELFIEDSFKRFMKDDCRAFFIKDALKNKFIGTVKLEHINFSNRLAMDGIMIGDKNYHGKKIAFKTYQILLKYAFTELKLYKIFGGCNVNNIPMIKIFTKIGYKQEGCFRNSDFIDGNYSDHLYFGIFKDEFINKNNINLEIVN